MPETPDPETSPDPAAAERVWISVVHVIKHSAGTYEIFVYDAEGHEAVHAPLVPDADGVEDALARFWRYLANTAGETAAPFN